MVRCRLALPRREEDLAEGVHLGRREDLGLSELVLKLVEALGVRRLGDGGLLVVGLEGRPDFLFVVHEVEDEGVGLPGEVRLSRESVWTA